MIINPAKSTRSSPWFKYWTPAVVVLLLALLLESITAETPLAKIHGSTAQPVKYIILMIGDGMGANQMLAANLYTGETPQYQEWSGHWMSTYEYGGGYDPQQAWTNFNYVKNNPTDSASAATALYTGVKTTNGRISVTVNGGERLYTITELARQAGWSVGAVSSVFISHATPGAWIAHNSSRNNGFAIADEGLWGNPNTTGTPGTNPAYGGGKGPTLPPVDVLIGAGHPRWAGGTFVNKTQRDKLAAENGAPGAFTFVERVAGSPDGGTRLLNAAGDPSVRRLAGLFGGRDGNLDYRMADGSGYNPENPTLEQEAEAALQVLSRNPRGFILMVESGAIDWAATDGNMAQMLGEVLDFNQAVQTVIEWVNEPNNDATWDNTLVIVTADHETGYLTAGPGQFPPQPLGEVSPRTLSLEKAISGTSRRASWEDPNHNNLIDPGETVYWAWNAGAHTNSLVPLYARGPGAELLAGYKAGDDPVRGAYMDNNSVHTVMAIEIEALISPTPTPEATPVSFIFLPLTKK
jgi:alkaline phosphatase